MVLDLTITLLHSNTIMELITLDLLIVILVPSIILSHKYIAIVQDISLNHNTTDSLHQIQPTISHKVLGVSYSPQFYQPRYPTPTPSTTMNNQKATPQPSQLPPILPVPASIDQKGHLAKSCPDKNNFTSFASDVVSSDNSRVPEYYNNQSNQIVAMSTCAQNSDST